MLTGLEQSMEGNDIVAIAKRLKTLNAAFSRPGKARANGLCAQEVQQV